MANDMERRADKELAPRVQSICQSLLGALTQATKNDLLIKLHICLLSESPTKLSALTQHSCTSSDSNVCAHGEFSLES